MVHMGLIAKKLGASFASQECPIHIMYSSILLIMHLMQVQIQMSQNICKTQKIIQQAHYQLTPVRHLCSLQISGTSANFGALFHVKKVPGIKQNFILGQFMQRFGRNVFVVVVFICIFCPVMYCLALATIAKPIICLV